MGSTAAETQNGIALDEYSALVSRENSPSRSTEKSWVRYWIMFMFGIVSMLPWFAFPAVEQYFRLNLFHHPSMARHIVHYVAIGVQAPTAVASLSNTWLVEWVSERVRVVVSLVTILVVFLLSMILAWVNTDNWQLTFFILTMISVVVISAAAMVFQGSVFAIASRYAPIHRQGVMGGQGFGGLVATSANVFSLLIAGGPSHLTRQELSRGAFGHFLSALILTVLALGGYFLLYHLDNGKNSTDPGAMSKYRPKANSSLRNIRRVTSQIWILLLSTFLCFSISLTIYPGIAAKVRSAHEYPHTCDHYLGNVSVNESEYLNGTETPLYTGTPTATGESAEKAWACTYFQPVVCFLMYAVFNFAGRSAPGLVRIPGPRYLLPCVVARFVFLLLYAFCKYSVYHRPFFNSDAAPAVFMVIVSFTNGYFNTLSFMYAPTLAGDEDADLVGVLMGAAEGTGSLFGVGLSFALSLLYAGPVQSHLPLVT